jgi:hypothetical protein
MALTFEQEELGLITGSNYNSKRNFEIYSDFLSDKLFSNPITNYEISYNFGKNLSDYPNNIDKNLFNYPTSIYLVGKNLITSDYTIKIKRIYN